DQPGGNGSLFLRNGRTRPEQHAARPRLSLVPRVAAPPRRFTRCNPGPGLPPANPDGRADRCAGVSRRPADPARPTGDPASCAGGAAATPGDDVVLPAHGKPVQLALRCSGLLLRACDGNPQAGVLDTACPAACLWDADPADTRVAAPGDAAGVLAPGAVASAAVECVRGTACLRLVGLLGGEPCGPPGIEYACSGGHRLVSGLHLRKFPGFPQPGGPSLRAERQQLACAAFLH